MDWSKIPDIVAVACLACAFSSILKSDRTAAHRLWLAGWTMIAVHFVGLMAAGIPGIFGKLAYMVALTTLVAAGICFMWATVPSETSVNSRRMALVTLLSTSFYLVLTVVPGAPGWSFDFASIVIALGPISVALTYRRYGQHPLRWLTAAMQFALGAELMVLRRQMGGNPEPGVDVALFVIYLGCCAYFWYSHQNGTTGSIITIGGFFAWAAVFAVSPAMEHFFPAIHVQDELWNLPKYVVAIGMLMLLLEKQIERSQYLALHDDLTSLANRRLFQDRLSSAIERARRSGTSIALLQVDLDRFKEVNDTHGHHMGDLLLRHVSQVLEMRVRRSDTVARTGGDEFSLILDQPSRRNDAEMVAESLSRSLSEPFLLAGRTVHIGASIGIAVFPEDAQDADSLCIEADLRMYRVKQTGRETSPNSNEDPEVPSRARHRVPVELH